MNYSWDTTFSDLFARCVERYRSGDEDFENYYTESDLSFLTSSGYKTRELFDFVEDHADSGGKEPSLGTALMVASVRRDFLHVIQNGKASDKVVLPEDLPARDSELGGHIWLPRIIVKARGKLHGDLDPDIMYGCGGDRKFLRTHDLHPADFLRAVWAAGDDDDKILNFVNQRGSSS
jgi:hypothetical protein